MLESITTFFYAARLGLKTGWETFLTEIWKYRSYKEYQRRRVF
jgi:hypothetical protein